MLFTFPSRYWFTIGLSDLFSLAGWSRRIRAEFHVFRVTQDTAIMSRTYKYATVTLCGVDFQQLLLLWIFVWRSPTTPTSPKRCRFGLFPVRSPLLRESRLFSFPVTTKMFQFITYASLLLHVILSLQLSGLSHSEIPGSKVICTLPGLIGAYHVLHRLREPRHPPVALSLLFFFWTIRPAFALLYLLFVWNCLLYFNFVEIYFVYKLSMNVHRFWC